MINFVVFDWKRTIYDPDTKELVDGALDLLGLIKNKDIQMVLVGKGGDDMHSEVERLDVKRFFRQIIFAEGEKDPQVYKRYLLKESSKETLFIGDRVRSELKIGKSLGATTIWVKQGKFSNEEPKNEGQKPDYTVSSLTECFILLQNLLN